LSGRQGKALAGNICTQLLQQWNSITSIQCDQKDEAVIQENQKIKRKLDDLHQLLDVSTFTWFLKGGDEPVNPERLLGYILAGRSDEATHEHGARRI
jgi:hypothetical protein